MKKMLFFSLLAAAVAFSSYTANKVKKPSIMKGPEVQVHGGKAWTWIQVSKQGKPEKLGVALTDEALKTVPIGGERGHGHMAGNHWVMKPILIGPAPP